MAPSAWSFPLGLSTRVSAPLKFPPPCTRRRLGGGRIKPNAYHPPCSSSLSKRGRSFSSSVLRSRLLWPGVSGLSLGLPEVPVPVSNPFTQAKIQLGRQLFFEKRLSEDRTLSCATCHDPQTGFSDGKRLSLGIHGSRGRRHTPSLINVAFQPYLFWDGRANSLEDQALAPFRNPVEMGGSAEEAVARLSRWEEYQQRFREVFESPITAENLAQALASFERTILSGNSPYDQFVAGDRTGLSPAALEGLRLFTGKAHCNLCHQGFNFSDGLFHNLGLGWNGDSFQDAGRYEVTGIFKDQGAFKTPTLREVFETAPYMHDGSLTGLEAVVDFYDRGGTPNPHLDILIQPLHLSREEKQALIEFLKSLNGQDRTWEARFVRRLRVAVRPESRRPEDASHIRTAPTRIQSRAKTTGQIRERVYAKALELKLSRSGKRVYNDLHRLRRCGFMPD